MDLWVVSLVKDGFPSTYFFICLCIFCLLHFCVRKIKENEGLFGSSGEQDGPKVLNRYNNSTIKIVLNLLVAVAVCCLSVDLQMIAAGSHRLWRKSQNTLILRQVLNCVFFFFFFYCKFRFTFDISDSDVLSTFTSTLSHLPGDGRGAHEYFTNPLIH